MNAGGNLLNGFVQAFQGAVDTGADLMGGTLDLVTGGYDLVTDIQRDGPGVVLDWVNHWKENLVGTLDTLGDAAANVDNAVGDAFMGASHWVGNATSECQTWNIRDCVHAGTTVAVIVEPFVPKVRLGGVGEVGATTSTLRVTSKIATQMGPRGWTTQLLEDTVRYPKATHRVWDWTTGSPKEATAYATSSNSYVVLNDATREVVQVSDRFKANWKPVWLDPRFKR